MKWGTKILLCDGPRTLSLKKKEAREEERSIYLFIYLFTYLFRGQGQGEGREKERVPSRRHAQGKVPPGAQSQDLEIVKWAEIKSRRPKGLRQPGFPKEKYLNENYCKVYIICFSLALPLENLHDSHFI